MPVNFYFEESSKNNDYSLPATVLFMPKHYCTGYYICLFFSKKSI
jgi:hypothetical protein